MRFAFSPEEVSRIAPMTLVTYDNAEYHTIGCRNTEDYLFCLSEGEALNFFSSDQARIARPTPYAERIASVPCWWLRSPGGHQFAFQFVSDKGAVDTNGFHATLDCVGIRPAMVVLPSDSSLVAAAVREGFYGRRIVSNVGYDLEYADADTARLLLERDNMTPKQANIAVAGGYPSITTINALLDQGEIGSHDRFLLSMACIRAKEQTLFERLVAMGSFDELSLRRLLNECTFAGMVPFADYLLRHGAKGQGYAKAYIPSATQEPVVVCAVAVDPEGAIAQWRSIQKFPEAIRMLCARFHERKDGVQTLVSLEGMLSLCAQYGLMEELRILTAEPNRAFTASMMTKAILAAKEKDHSDIVAFLIDRQDALFSQPLSRPSSTVSRNREGFTPRVVQGYVQPRDASQEAERPADPAGNDAHDFVSSQEPEDRCENPQDSAQSLDTPREVSNEILGRLLTSRERPKPVSTSGPRRNNPNRPQLEL